MTLRLALAVIAAVLGTVPAAARGAELPDLTITLPSQPYVGQVAPVYVDRFEEPGRVLYRFDSLIRNDGGTLDLFRDADTGEAMQALWPGGQPSTPPDPEAPPPSGTPLSARGAAGARFEYVFEDTHNHWHFFSAAAYELEVPGQASRVSGKIGFCLYDSFDTDGVSEWFPEDPPGPGTWCHFSAPDSDFVRMGLSPGAADRYASQREFQYVDVTGLAPGAYVLRGTANPEGHVLEGDGLPDEREETRVVPGVLADAISATTAPGTPVALTLGGRAVAPQVPARLRAGCQPSATSKACYLWLRPDDRIDFAVAEAPRHGSVAIDGARAVYTPAPGFTGSDRFTYTATDARGLTSRPAAADVSVPAPLAMLAPPAPGTTVAPPARTARRLLRIAAARLRGRRTLRVRIRCAAAAKGACAGVITAKLGTRRVGRRAYARLAAGRSRTLRIRLTRRPGKRRLAVTATVRDAAGAGITARRTLTPPRRSAARRG